ncbi:TIGR01212 family radical SAM protein [uncultured Desulfovibrio sp.]|uniref:TIGR01212 family radical SAM protein n=1 Tax=uncultured Desulfovibrio sp. TaxID=167968 RepID=UPI00261F7D6C|nr:TIGR01212 family radical SAM protein [uncultured Desulfovibrio sp.]
MLLWHTLATYFRRKYGVRVQKIPLDAGATCPNRDGTLSRQGCVFCNDSGSGSGMGLRGLGLRAQWDAWYGKYTATDSDRLFMAYLQSFSNTYGPADRLARLLGQVAALPGCRGIAVGTRPDCLDSGKLALLAGCGLDEVWLELGLQTCRDATLRRINRGHTVRQAETAVRAALEAGLLVCGHLMAGLPGEEERDFLDGVDWAVSLGLQGLKLHNVYVPQGTGLARLWQAGDYHPLARDEYVDWLCAALPRIPSTVVMQRIQADPAPGELLAPSWALEKRGIITDLRRALAARGLWQGCRADATDGRPAWFGG